MTTPVLFVKRFTVLDFARVGPTGFEGESLYVDAEVYGRLDTRGFLLDFGPVKKLLKTCVDDVLDHRFAVPRCDPRVHLHNASDGRLRVQIDGLLDYTAPLCAFALFDSGQIGSDEISEFLRNAAIERMPANVVDVRFFLSSESQASSRPSYRYTHGLKQHEGNCQRLIHGHRNIVEVFLDGERHPRGEEILADLFDNVHFTHIEDTSSNVVAGERGGHGWVEIEYKSNQGIFHGQLPSARVLSLRCEPTVENIASFAHRYLSDELSVDEARLAVIAYEGIHKGARVGGSSAGER